MINGNLIIRPLEANIIHNTEFLGKMSPYLKCILGNESKCTDIAKKAHKKPTWNTELVFRYHGEQSLRVELWDKDKISKDDLIGYGTFDLSERVRMGQFLGDIPLFYKDKDAGFLRLSMNFFEDGSPYNPFSSQQLAKQPTQQYSLAQSMPGSTVMGTNVVESTFMPSQTNFSTQRNSYQGNMEPIIHHETTRLYEQPIYIHQRPVIHEKTVIIEKPIITEKTIIETEYPIIKEICELREKTFYQKQEPLLIRENPIVRQGELVTSLDRLNLEGEPIVTRQTEVRRELPEYRTQQTEVFEKQVIHERPIIHEKDIYYVEKPVWIEKPEILERPVLQQGTSQLMHADLLRREVLADDLTIPNEALRHTDRVVLKEPAVFMKERPEIYEKEVVTERPIFYEQPVIYTENQEIHEQSEYVEKRGRRVEQAVVERSEFLVRNDDLNLQNSRNTLESQRWSENQSLTGLHGSKVEGQKSTYDVA